MDPSQQKCEMVGCGGQIDFDSGIRLKTGCAVAGMAFPCKKCGRLHFTGGSMVFRRDDAAVFLKDGQLVHVAPVPADSENWDTILATAAEAGVTVTPYSMTVLERITSGWMIAKRRFMEGTEHAAAVYLNDILSGKASRS